VELSELGTGIFVLRSTPGNAGDGGGRSVLGMGGGGASVGERGVLMRTDFSNLTMTGVVLPSRLRPQHGFASIARARIGGSWRPEGGALAEPTTKAPTFMKRLFTAPPNLSLFAKNTWPRSIKLRRERKTSAR